MATTLEVSGQIRVPGGTLCEPCCGGQASSKMVGLALSCSATSFGAVVSTDSAVTIATAGAVGDEYVELPCSGSLSVIAFAFIRTTAAMRLLIDGAVPQILGTGAVYPVSLAAEDMTVTVDGNPVVVTFGTGSFTAQDVANQINSAFALSALAPIASVATSGQLQLDGFTVGPSGTLEVADTSGTPLALLGLPTGEVAGTGSEVDVNGVFMVEFGVAAGVNNIFISGSGQIEVLLAGNE